MQPEEQKTAPIVSEFANDANMIEHVEQFLCRLPKWLGEVRQAVVRNDTARVANLASRITSAAAGYGFPMIRDVAERLASCAESNATRDRLDETLAQLVNLCSRARATFAA